jgi:hypothetical protein
MDSFVRLHALYRSVTRWQIIAQIYRHATLRWKLGLWGGKFLFALCAILQFLLQPWWFYFISMLLSSCLWAWSFEWSRRAEFSELYRVYSDRLSYFSLDYQYIRYLRFREKLQSSYTGSVDDALLFLNEQIDTSSKTAVSSHPVISFLLGAAVAVFGGAVVQWPAKYIAATLLFLVACAYIFYIALGALKTPQSDLKEFRRFLLWARDEPLENSPTTGP